MADVSAFLTFCEDVRMEVGDKPMLIGLLSPMFHTGSNPGYPDHVFLATFLNIEHNVEEVTLDLTVTIENPVHDNEKGEFQKVIPRPDDLVDNEPWGAFLPLRLDVPEWADGTTISASLVANGTTAKARLRCAVWDDDSAEVDEQEEARQSSASEAARSGGEPDTA